MPNLSFNYLAIVVSIFMSFAFSGLWYGPLFGKRWAQLMGIKMDKKVDCKLPKLSVCLQLLGTVLTVYVLAYEVQIWRPSVWGVGMDKCACTYGLCAGLFTWLGFYVPMMLGTVAWERRPWKLFLLNATYNFLNLQMIAGILANWR